MEAHNQKPPEVCSRCCRLIKSNRDAPRGSACRLLWRVSNQRDAETGAKPPPHPDAPAPARASLRTPPLVLTATTVARAPPAGGLANNTPLFVLLLLLFSFSSCPPLWATGGEDTTECGQEGAAPGWRPASSCPQSS